MNKYFCNTCGLHFESEKTDNVTCPNCGVYDIYPDTAEGASQSVKDLTDYENEIEFVDTDDCGFDEYDIKT